MKTAINPRRDQDFAKWYQEVIKQADLAENAPVRGCMVIKPYAYAIWENIQALLDAKFKKLGVQNAYFPLLIPLDFLKKEADHIEGFAKECAVVTHSKLTKQNGELKPDSELAEPFIIRPTSEAIIGNVVSNWIKTYKDLPLKLNQWCNVMRWELRPRLFLRTSEFLWQEGHTIFETPEEANADAIQMINLYYEFTSQTLALPILKGEKTIEEKFPGAKNTYTIEGMMQDGKALQAGTSHYLGDSFSKPFNIKFTNRDCKEYFAYTASWGLTTRLIGAIVMAHADDDGLVLPSAIAPHQIVIIPIIHDDSNKERIIDHCKEIASKLGKMNLRFFIDDSEHKTPDKIWKWIKKGAPIRLEIGMKEIEEGKMTVSCRTQAREKQSINMENISFLKEILNDFDETLKNRSAELKNSKTLEIQAIEDLEKNLNQGFSGFFSMPKQETEKKEFEEIAKKFHLSRRCILESDRVIVAKSY